MPDDSVAPKATALDKAKLLVEEWTLLAGYVDRGFTSLESQSAQIVVLLATAVGVISEKLRLPEYVWLFIAPAIFAIMLRMKAQAAFTYFQSSRIIEIEDEINRLLGTTDGRRIFNYAHAVSDLSPQLGRGLFYPYPFWIVFTDLIGVVTVLFAALRSASWLSDNRHPTLAFLFLGFFALAVAWYLTSMVFISKRFYDSVEGHREQHQNAGKSTGARARTRAAPIGSARCPSGARCASVPVVDPSTPGE